MTEVYDFFNCFVRASVCEYQRNSWCASQFIKIATAMHTENNIISTP